MHGVHILQTSRAASAPLRSVSCFSFGDEAGFDVELLGRKEMLSF